MGSSIALTASAPMPEVRGAGEAKGSEPFLMKSHVHLGYELRAYAAGDPSPELPAVVFIHGMLEGWDVWKEVYRTFLPGYSVYFLEFPWAGKQDNLWGFRAQPGEWIRQGLTLLPANVSTVVAHSFGANALLEYFCLYGTGSGTGTGSAEKVVMLSPFYKKAYADFEWTMFTHYVANLGRFMEECLRVRQGNRPMPKEILDAVSAKVKDQLGVVGWLHFFNLFTRMPGLDLRSLDADFLVIGGMDDFSSLPGDCEALAESLPGSRSVLIPDCGHFCMLEKPELVRASLAHFLRIAIQPNQTTTHSRSPQ